MQHLNASLDDLVKNLTHSSTDQLKHLENYVDEEYEGSPEKFELLTRKGVYPYSYIRQADNFLEGMLFPWIKTGVKFIKLHFKFWIS